MEEFFCRKYFTELLLGEKRYKNTSITSYSRINDSSFCHTYSVFHRFRHAKFAIGGSILSSSQFLILPQKMKLASKVVKINPKIIFLLTKI